MNDRPVDPAIPAPRAAATRHRNHDAD